MKGSGDFEVYDGMAFGGEGAPTEWRLLRTGENRLAKGGREMVLPLSFGDVSAIAAFQRAKGEKIPIDSRHALYLAASKFGCEESDLAALAPGGTGAVGYGNLEARSDGLWITDVEWLPLARKAVAEGMFRYFSPVLRGISDGRPRVTSVALDNVPALSGLDVLAAGGEQNQATKETIMDEKLKKALAALLGVGADALPMGGEGGELAAKLEELAATIAEMKKAAEKAERLEREIADLKARNGELEAANTELAMAQETAEKGRMLDEAARDGRICNAQRESLSKMPRGDLAAMLEGLPKGAFPMGGEPTAKPPRGAEGALTEAEKAVCRMTGVSEEDFAAARVKKD